MDENAVGTCAELIFAPIDASFADDAPLLPSGFRIIPLDSAKVSLSYSQSSIIVFGVWYLPFYSIHFVIAIIIFAGSIQSKSHT